MSNELERAREALSGIKSALAADRYGFEVASYRDRVMSVRITARPGACPECLIPEHTMAALIRTQVPSDIAIDAISVDVVPPAEG